MAQRSKFMLKPKLSRKNFLKLVGSFGALTLISRAKRAYGLIQSDPLFSFVVAPDIHVQHPDSAVAPNISYPFVEEKFNAIISDINNGAQFPTPDFFMAPGDMVHGGLLELLAPDHQKYAEMLATLTIPHYPGVGNHENKQYQGIAAYEAAYKSTFGSDKLNYTFTHGGVMFIVLDNSGYILDSHAAAIARDTWLQTLLQNNPSIPKIIACHIPLIPLREESVLAASFGFTSYKMRTTKMLNIIEGYSDSVIAIFTGHLHLTGVKLRNSIYHIGVSGTASYPCHYGHVKVFSDHIDIKMYKPPQTYVDHSRNIHGIPRYTFDYTDADHTTGEAYVAGNPDEQEFTIALPVSKQISGETILENRNKAIPIKFSVISDQQGFLISAEPKGKYNLTVYSTDGRLIKNLAEGSLNNKIEHTFRPQSAGAYFVKLQ